MVGQLVLVIYMWVQKDKYLDLMSDVVEKAWERRTRRADYMDAIQISVSKCKENMLRIVSIYSNFSYRWNAVVAPAIRITPSRVSSPPRAVVTPTTVAQRPSIVVDASKPLSITGIGTAISSSILAWLLPPSK